MPAGTVSRISGGKEHTMKTHHKDYGITASITDRPDGTARLIARNQYGEKVKDKIYASRRSARSAWAGMCK